MLVTSKTVWSDLIHEADAITTEMKKFSDSKRAMQRTPLTVDNIKDIEMTVSGLLSNFKTFKEYFTMTDTEKAKLEQFEQTKAVVMQLKKLNVSDTDLLKFVKVSIPNVEQSDIDRIIKAKSEKEVITK